ncbi:MAG: NAD(P)-dependent oxidoreductase [Chthoniobacteraceae bacterium]
MSPTKRGGNRCWSAWASNEAGNSRHGGRLGAALAREYASAFEVLAFNRQALDLSQPAALEQTLSTLDFDALINCAALTNVDYCETNEAEAMAINAEAAGLIGRICKAKGARCIHISTDYVFDGEKREPYTESDLARAISVYGESKLQGELRVAEATDNAALSVRVSWVFGPDRPSFVDGVIKRALESDQAAAVADKWAVPTYTLDVAAMLKPFISELRSEGGVLHLCNGGVATWQEYGQYALDCAAARPALEDADGWCAQAYRSQKFRRCPSRLQRDGHRAPQPARRRAP